MSIFAFQLSNGAFGLISADSESQAAEIVARDYGESVEIIDAQDIIDSQYSGLAFLTTESE